MHFCFTKIVRELDSARFYSHRAILGIQLCIHVHPFNFDIRGTIEHYFEKIEYSIFSPLY